MSKTSLHIRALLCCSVFCVPAGAGTIHVRAGANGINDGTTWANAFTSLPAAIQRASAGDELWAAEGTYGPIRLKSGVKLYGGFGGTETNVSQSDPDAHRTYISGRGETRAVVGIGDSASTEVRGFYITNGFIDFPDMGGGMYLENSDAMFVRCVFTANQSVTMGGAIAIWGGSPTFVNCKFHGNDGGWAAGAVFSRRGAAPTFVNCLFYENKALETGAVTVLSGAATFVNCTIADNESRIGNPGALSDIRGDVVLHNCILWNNRCPVPGGEEIYNLPPRRQTTTATQCNIKGGWPGEGNLGTHVDPLFVDPANDDYRLQAGSPCRNAGRNAALPPDVADLTSNGNRTETLPKDLDLRDRITGDTVDMGAFEWHP